MQMTEVHVSVRECECLSVRDWVCVRECERGGVPGRGTACSELLKPLSYPQPMHLASPCFLHVTLI